jgi:hypothetical protein
MVGPLERSGFNPWELDKHGLLCRLGVSLAHSTWLPSPVPPEDGSAYSLRKMIFLASPLTSLHQKQRTHKYMMLPHHS